MSQVAERRMPKAVLLSPTLTASWPSQPVRGERISLLLFPGTQLFWGTHPPPAPLTLTPSLAVHVIDENWVSYRFLPHFLMLIRAGSGEHVWNQVRWPAPLTLVFLFHAKEDVAGFASVRHTHSINTD